MRRSAVLVLVVGLLLLATPLAVWGQTAGDEEPTFTGFSLTADASGMSVIFGSPGAQPYPTAQGTVPSTVSTLSTGPSGTAQASAAWPGPLVGNAGTLAGVVLPLCVPDGNGVCTPKPDGQTLQLLNYPVRAEASSPAGESDAALGPLYAHSKGTSSSANATVTDFSSNGLVSSTRVTSVSRTFVAGGAATSVGETVIAGISAAGGAVKIESLRTIAKVVSDGTKSTKTRQITVTGLEIGGQKATVDERGVHFGDQGSDSPLDPAVSAANEQIMSNFGIKMFLTRPLAETDKEGTVRLNTGALGLIWDIPESGGQQVIVTLGGSGVISQVSAGSALALPDVAGGAGLSDVGGASGSVGGGDLSTGGGSIGAGAGDVGNALALGEAAPGVSNGSAGSVGSTTLDTEPVAGHVGFDGIAIALVIAALLGAVLAGVGLGRLQLLALAPARSGACQNEGRGGGPR